MEKQSEEQKSSFIRRGVSLSPYVDDIAQKMAVREFSGNLSAFIAHTILHYVKCQRCVIRNEIDVDFNNFSGTNKGVVKQVNAGKK